MNKARILFIGVGAVALSMGMMSPASAQTDESAASKNADDQSAATDDKAISADGAARLDDLIVVTGSRIRRTSLDSAAPIAEIQSETIVDRGLGRLGDALSLMSQVSPILGDRGSNDPRIGAARISLRSLGAGRTLVLLNGERMDNDANAIPSPLIERVDILSGGASAVYGSDAVAGVVNFIVKRRFEGVEINLDASAQQSTNDNAFMLDLLEKQGYPRPDKHAFGGEQYFGSVAAGQSFADDRGNISMFASYTRTLPMAIDKFDHTACPVFMNPQNPVPAVQKNDQWSCGFNEFNPYNWFDSGGDYWTNAKDGSREWRKYDTADINRVPQTDYLQRSGRRTNSGAFLTFDLSNALRFDSSILYTYDESEGQNALADAFYAPQFQIPCDNPFMSQQQARIVCGDNAGVAGTTAPFSMTVFRPNNQNEYHYGLNTWRAAAHLSGKIVDDINFDASLQRSKRIEKYFGTNIFDWWRNNEKFARAMQVVNVNGKPTCQSVVDGTDPACIPLDAFTSKGPNPAVWNYLTSTGGSRVEVEQLVATGSVSGTLEKFGLKSPWAFQGIGFALVAEHRWNRVAETGSGAYDWWSRYDGVDKVDELGGELSLPIVQGKPLLEDLTISGAYRLSRYQSLDDLVKTWKADFVYRPFQGLGFRGSVNRALRRGFLERLQQANPYQAGFQDRCATPAVGSEIQRLSAAQCATVGVTQAQYNALADPGTCNTAQFCDALFRPGGNPDLRPETSRSVTAGVVMQPRFLPGFSASLDFFSIKIEGAFEWVRTDIISDQCFNQQVEFFCGLITRDANTGRVTEINARYNNSGFLKQEGVDFSLNYPLELSKETFGTDLGRLNLSLSGTVNTSNKRQFAPNTPVYSCLGYFGFFCRDVTPRYRHYLNIGWDMPWKGNINLSWRYASPTKNSKLSPEPPLASRPSPTNTDTYPLLPKLPAQSLFDLAMSYPLTGAVDVRFNVQNLFDKDPPIVGRADAGTGEWQNTFPWFYNSWGRTLRIGLTAKLW